MTHPLEDLHRFVNELNVRYNIGIPIPPSDLSHAEGRASETPAGRIYRRLEVHFFRGGLETLRTLLEEFDHKAKDFWSSWVKKPQADADTLPRTAYPPLAANLTQRDWLQAIFNEILDQAQMPTTRTFGRVQSGPAAFGCAPPEEGHSVISAQSKRRADVELGDGSKRTKSDLTSDDTTAGPSLFKTSASASYGTHQGGASAQPSRVGKITPAFAKTSMSFQTSFASATTASTGTNPTSFTSTGFSRAGPLPGTQDTIAASTQEHPREAPSPSQGPYFDAPSSTMEDALITSFNEHDVLLGPGKDPRSRNSLLSPTDVSDNSSYPASSCMLEAMRSASRRYDTVGDKPPESSSARIEASIFARSRPSAASEISCTGPYASAYLHWPKFPVWLREAPFPIAWEVTRVAVKCGVDLTSLDNLQYTEDWKARERLHGILWQHPAFQGKLFPAKPDPKAWDTSLASSAALPHDSQAVYAASIDFTSSKTIPFRLTLQPVKLDDSHRLARKYGADRFLELLVPSPDSSNLPNSIAKDNSFFTDLISWISGTHFFCGRRWKAFYTKSGGSRKPVREIQFGPDPKPVFKDRIYFFAENYEDPRFVPVRTERLESISRHKMLHWAFDFNQKSNRNQPILKLFQRTALVLSRTKPTVVFDPEQMRHRNEDLLSPIGKVMNDGVARMSRAVARMIRHSLGLISTPSAVQGRLGSAKGMWIIDVCDTTDDVWIETYPSQRKWNLDWSKETEHRTLEIRNVATLPKRAAFNLQFLPVIEDRAINKAQMREAIGDLLKTNLRDELDGQKKALQSPLQFRQWGHENASHKHDRIIHGRVPFQGGMPQEDEELMNCMLDAGFDPRQNKFLKEIIYAVQRRRCETLSKKLNITVGRSAYFYMVIDFQGILEEDEVHLGFSTAFQADDDWAKTMVQGHVLVARSPAHYTSDIQKVRAVFKSELADLTDVIVFSSKGDVPLADKLSGGDYDGDLAWVCWDKRIVDNFQNAPVQEQPDLSQWMSQDKETFRQMVQKNNKSLKHAIAQMMNKSFEFNLSKSMLGVCTNYKERLCYHRNNVSDDAARMLSTLLSNLVDQAKQGIKFTAESFQQLRSDHSLPIRVDDPLYKKEHWPYRGRKASHIIDYLKFDIAKPVIAEELKDFHAALNTSVVHHWDPDLATLYSRYEESDSKSAKRLLLHLKEDIGRVVGVWDGLLTTGNDNLGYPEKVAQTYAEWQRIELPVDFPADKRHLLEFGGETSLWQLLKASTAFWMYCNSSGSTGLKPRFVWQMACRQLCYLKAQAVTCDGPFSVPSADNAPTVVVPSMYAVLRPDAKIIKQIVARNEGRSSQFDLGDFEDDSDLTNEED